MSVPGPFFCAELSRVTEASRQKIAREPFDALQGLERGAQTAAVAPRQTSDRDPIGRGPAVLDVLDLLTEDQTEKGLLCVGQRIEVGLAAAVQGFDAREAAQRRALDHVMPNGERPGYGHDAEQSGLLQID